MLAHGFSPACWRQASAWGPWTPACANRYDSHMQRLKPTGAPIPLIARHDPRLEATVVARHALLYGTGADEALDMPAYVRAASSIVRIGTMLAIVQDDANFIALLDPDARQVLAVVLPAGHEGRRQFDDLRGTKRYKLDLEACTVIDGRAGPRLLAFGSGSTGAREHIVTVDDAMGDAPLIRLIDASSLYDGLRAATDFAGSELNIEGATIVGDALRLFQRGNGAPRGLLQPVDATCDLSLAELIAYLADPDREPPAPTGIIQYELGSVGGCRLTFTDATRAPGGLLYAASAEASPDAVSDGPVAGSALGMLTEHAPPRWTLLRDVEGNLFGGKVEGATLDGDDPRKLYVVVDSDDPLLPGELCVVRLSGPWF